MDKQRIIALNAKKRAPVQPQSCSVARFTRILPEFRLLFAQNVEKKPLLPWQTKEASFMVEISGIEPLTS